jgi:RecA-family ATPase
MRETLEERIAKVNEQKPEIRRFPDMVSAAELLNRKVECVPTLVEPILPRSGLVCLAGSSDAGKSALLRQLCIHIVTGEEYFLGFRVKPVHKKAIYVSTEDDESAISYLLNRQNTDRKYPHEQCQGLTYIFDTENLLEQLDHHLLASSVDVIVIDAFADLFGKSSMNDSNHVRAFLHPYKLLADRHSCLIIFLHHTGKRTEENEPSKHNLLGSQGFEAKMRLVIELRADHVEADKRHLCIVKGNYLPSAYKQESFLLRFDENMLFYDTGQRAAFETLIKQQGVRPEMVDKFTRAKELKEQGYSYEKIAAELGYQNRGAVHKLLNDSSVSRSVSQSVSQGNEQETPTKEAFPCFPTLGKGNEETPVDDDKIPF